MESFLIEIKIVCNPFIKSLLSLAFFSEKIKTSEFSFLILVEIFFFVGLAKLEKCCSLPKSFIIESKLS